VEMFHWTVRDIDETDIESLIPFIFYYPQWKEKKKTSAQPKEKQAYADEIDL
jgi:hypothetical protein